MAMLLARTAARRSVPTLRLGSQRRMLNNDFTIKDMVSANLSTHTAQLMALSLPPASGDLRYRSFRLAPTSRRPRAELEGLALTSLACLLSPLLLMSLSLTVPHQAQVRALGRQLGARVQGHVDERVV